VDYTALENSIVTRLSPLSLVGIEVLPLPEADADVVNPFDKGKITVAYLSSDFDQSVTTDCVAQPEKITFQLVVQSRTLRGTTGIYPVLTAIKSLVLGWKTATTDKIQFSKAQYDAHENGVWTYHINVTTENLAIEQPDDVTVVIATQITLENENETIDVVQEFDDGVLSQITTIYDQSFKKFYRSPVAGNCTFTIPAGYQLMQATFKNTTAHPISVLLGTTSGANDILMGSAMDIPASTLITNGTIMIQFSESADQIVYLSSPDWNNASLKVLLTCIKSL
jgi:hypothetical protein